VPKPRRIVIIAEGDTERAAKDHLKRFLDGEAQRQARPRVGLHVVTYNGSVLRADLERRARQYLSDPSTVGVVALTDVYPEFHSADEARAKLRALLPNDPRCHGHVAKHDFEAWLLVGWEAILRHARISDKKPWAGCPEAVNSGKPPAHRLQDLFNREAKPPRKYKKPIDGKRLFEALDLIEVSRRCPEFYQFLCCLMMLAGYKPLQLTP
jgi:hypothetical protein